MDNKTTKLTKGKPTNTPKKKKTVTPEQENKFGGFPDIDPKRLMGCG